MTDTTVVIKTIGRPTVHNAVKSAKREGFNTFVISDGVKGIRQTDADRHLTLGRKWGFYGGMVANVGAALVESEFITFLDDDDEFAPGAGDIIRRKLREDPTTDMWVGGIQMNGEVNIFDSGIGWIRRAENPKTWQSIRTNKKGTTLFTSDKLGIRPELGPISGNVCMVTYRTSIFGKVPFKDCIPDFNIELTDYFHAAHCLQEGYSIDWFGDILYLVRPKFQDMPNDIRGYNGGGQ
tara:strand:+ start:3176 stop:3886 length:711 start_codon:yes stop_codon:yes gene_type:complete